MSKYKGGRGIPDLAKKMGLSKQAVYQWADSGNIQIDKVLSVYPDVNVDYLLTGEGYPFNKGPDRKDPNFSTLEKITAAEGIVNEKGIPYSNRMQAVAYTKERLLVIENQIASLADLIKSSSRELQVLRRYLDSLSDDLKNDS